MEKNNQNKMGTQPIPALLRSMGLPIMASMLIQALYNIVDSMYVARLGDAALTALSLAFPIQLLLIAVSVGTGVGVNTLLARRLGEKDKNGASEAAVNGLFCAILSGATFALFGFFGVEAYFKIFTEDPTLISMGVSYTSICTIFAVGIITLVVSERIIQATGKPIYSMIAQMTGAIANIILDPIFIFGLFGVPAMGVAGAAVATVISQFLGLIVITYFNITKATNISLSLKNFKPNFTVIRNIYHIGVPSIIMQSIGTIMTVGMNAILIGFSETAVAVFGIYFKLQSFVFMPVFGLTAAMIPIISFNYGAKSKERIDEAIKFSIIGATSIMVIGTLIFQVGAGWMFTTFFNASNEMLNIGIPALRIISIAFIPIGTAIVISCTLQAIGSAVSSLVISIIRQLILILPVAWILGRLFGLNAVWLSFPISEITSLIISIFLFKSAYNNKIKDL